MELRDRHQATKVYTIRQVAEMTGVPENTIRSWERRFGIPRPARSGGNQRRYTERDAAVIRAIQASRDRGRTMEQALQDLNNDETSTPTPEPGPRPAGWLGAPEAEADEPGLPQPAAVRLVTSLSAFDGPGADACIEEQLWGSTVETVCIDILLPALRAIDEQLAASRAADIQVRYAKAWLRRKLDTAFSQSNPDAGRLNIMVAAMHDVSARDDALCLSIILSRAGYRVSWLGSGATPAGLGLAIDMISPTAIVLASRSDLSRLAVTATVEDLLGSRQAGARQGLIAVLDNIPAKSNDIVHLTLHATEAIASFERALHARDSMLRLVRNK